MLTASSSLSRRSHAVHHLVLSVETRRPLEFVDMTAAISAAVQGLQLLEGIVTIHTQHTTTGILINEHEPLLLEDLEAMFERIAPASATYAHDDPGRRSVNRVPDERRNGHAHCRAAILGASESVPVSDGTLLLGRWQRIFFVDFDGGQQRQISLVLMGETGEPGLGPRP